MSNRFYRGGEGLEVRKLSCRWAVWLFFMKILEPGASRLGVQRMSTSAVVKSYDVMRGSASHYTRVWLRGEAHGGLRKVMGKFQEVFLGCIYTLIFSFARRRRENFHSPVLCLLFLCALVMQRAAYKAAHVLFLTS